MFTRHRMRVLLVALIAASVVSAQTADFTIAPSSGPGAGGQQVAVTASGTRSFGAWPYSLIFGSTSVPAERIDAQTLRAVTPPHAPGTVEVVVFEYDMGISSGLEYTFVDSGDAFKRVLLPIYTPPVAGAHGSEFRVDFRAMNVRHDAPLQIHGVREPCDPAGENCVDPHDVSYTVGARSEIEPGTLSPTGTPGAFLYVAEDKVDDLVMQLRAYDVSRDATNFGTEIPVVHEDEFVRDQPLTFLGVPSDARFRNTLRIYGTTGTTVAVRIETRDGLVDDRIVQLIATGDPTFAPAYAQISGFPTDRGPLRVTVQQITPVITTPILADVWAFISVTNNETQHITIISPQR